MIRHWSSRLQARRKRLLYLRRYVASSREEPPRRNSAVPLGYGRASLVFVSIPPPGGVFRRQVFSQIMTAMHTLGLCMVLFVSVLLLAGAGAVVLRLFKVAGTSAADTFLFSITLGVIILDLAVSLGELAPLHRIGLQIAIAAVGLLGLAGVKYVFLNSRELAPAFASLARTQKWLACVLLVVLALQGAASFAPLTGSDALHYHFTIQSLVWNEGFHANWSLLHGFFCGLSHQLILAGIALGSGSLAQGWLFLGGALGALATLRIAQLWVAGVWPWLAALAFALTPVVFWQTIAAGAPDVWMCAFVPLCLLTILRARQESSFGPIVLAGIFAGATAGTKYTGVIFAGALLAGFVVSIRSTAKAALFFAAAVVTGFWPYLRNWIWTGDPVFPFLYAHSHYGQLDVNQTALSAILNDTGATHAHSLADVIKFPLFAGIDQQHFGPWLLLGPLVLAFGPLAIPQLRKNADGRLALIVWILGALGIGFSSAMPRFLLPLLPVALAASVAGVALLTADRWRILRITCQLSLAGVILIGFAAMIIYSRPAWSAVAGRTSQDAYLKANSPDYERSQFVNREVARFAENGRVLVFFRHLYYLRVPVFSGDPENSWEANPAQLTTPQAWNAFFAKHQIRWVLKSPGYPETLADSLNRLETVGLLRICAAGEVESFSGNRMAGKRAREPITLYCVQAAHFAP